MGKSGMALRVGFAINMEDVRITQDAHPEPQATFYSVQPGNTLSKIAKQYFGDANQYPRLFETNRSLL
jgi:nucleoid-associated protein YgaU